MRLAILLALVGLVSGCASDAVIKQVENTEACGSGSARLIPTEGDIWLVLCQDGRVSWIDDAAEAAAE